MISLVRGEVAVRRPDHVILLAAGVGYRLAVSAETLRHVPAAGQAATLHAHLIATDDTLALYGFHTEAERDLFLLLTSVPQVGPKVALAVLSGGAPRDLLAAIAAGDADRFQAVKGIGKRTAERIIVELREKVGATVVEGLGPIVARRGNEPRALARDGLIELGYTPVEADGLLGEAEGDSAEELLASALRTARSA